MVKIVELEFFWEAQCASLLHSFVAKQAEHAGVVALFGDAWRLLMSDDRFHKGVYQQRRAVCLGLSPKIYSPVFF